MTVELGIIGILLLVVIASIGGWVSSRQQLGKVKAELSALRATSGAQTGAMAAMSTLPDPDKGAQEILDAAKARAAKNAREKKKR